MSKLPAICCYQGLRKRHTFYTISRPLPVDPRVLELESKASIIINVSERKYSTKTKLPYFHIPIIETVSWGYEPFYKVVQLLHKQRKRNQNVVFHCRAGLARSPALAIVFCKALNGEVINPPLKRYKRYETLCKKKRIPENIVEFVKLSMAHPTYSLNAIKRRLLPV